MGKPVFGRADITGKHNLEQIYDHQNQIMPQTVHCFP